MQQQQQEFNELLNTLMESVEKFQEGESGEGNYLVAMNCLRSLHGFGGRIGDDGCEGRLRGMVDDLEVDLLSAQDALAVAENELEKLRDWKACMSVHSEDPEWCKRCGSWDTDFDEIKETEEYGYICRDCRLDLDCLFDDEVEGVKKRIEEMDEEDRRNGLI